MLDEIPLLLAFTGGLVATVNPCGIAMLPAYLSFFLGLEGPADQRPRTVGVGSALRVGATVAAGFLLVFGVAWVLLAAGIRAVIAVVPWAALVVGLVVLVPGVWMLTGRPLPIKLPTPGKAAEGRSTGAIVLFGLGYAVASLSCTLPVFLAVVAGTATRLSLGAGLATFGVYAVGMALPLLALTIGLAVGRDTLVLRVRRLGGVITRLAGGLLVVAGLYIVVYWSAQLAGLTGGPLAPVVLGVERASAQLSQLIGDRPVLWSSIFIAVVVLAVVAMRLSRRRAGDEPEREQENVT